MNHGKITDDTTTTDTIPGVLSELNPGPGLLSKGLEPAVLIPAYQSEWREAKLCRSTKLV